MNIENSILFFKDEYEIFSNFYLVEIEFEGIIYPSTEHAYAASKSKDKMFRYKVSKEPSPGKAKKMGRYVKLRDDWEIVKFSIMEQLVRKKFNIPELKEILLSTGNLYIEEGNYWHDNTWGNCHCKKCINIEGKNHLGRILMKVRNEFQLKI